jgi:hypothetical protein
MATPTGMLEPRRPKPRLHLHAINIGQCCASDVKVVHDVHSKHMYVSRGDESSARGVERRRPEHRCGYLVSGGEGVAACGSGSGALATLPNACIHGTSDPRAPQDTTELDGRGTYRAGG